MTITSIKSEMEKASNHSYAIPLFDVFDQFGVDGVFDAIEEKKSPVILGIYSGAKIFRLNAPAFIAYIRSRAERISSPVAIMLDHGSSVEQCMYALECGFTDVMYDGSDLPLDQNIANTRKVVEFAKTCGAGVEAELGHVGSGHTYDTYGSQRLGFTDPELVNMFVSATEIDFLAIAFGNAHGLYKGEPRLDLNLIREVRNRIQIPLVMHGGTGLIDAQYREVIFAGISKVNIFTAIHNVATQRMILAANSENPSMFSISEQIQAAYRDVCSHFFEIFGTANKA